MTADLHVHTTASDGRLSPREILRQAVEAGLSYFSVTDHDTVDGQLELIDLMSTELQCKLVPGIEFSTDLPHNEVHILGYFIDIKNPQLNEQITIIADDRLRRAERMVNKLGRLGYHIKYKRVLEIAGNATAIGRPHVAAALLEKGYFSNIEDVFNKVLEKNKPAYVPHYKLTPAEVIELITFAGGIPVLAHPGLVGNDSIVREMIDLGIKGLEIYHPKHSSADIVKYETLAAEYNLVPTGGSDYHGISGRYPEKLGIFTIPSELVLRLQHLKHELAATGI